MPVIITPATNTVEVNGRSAFVDLSGLDPNIKQVKWWGAYGVIHRPDIDGEEGPTDRITSIAEFAGIIAQANLYIQQAGTPAPLTLNDAKAAALLLIDAEAGQARGRFITVTPGQEMTYQEKVRQVQAFMTDPEPSESKYPLIYGEVGITAETAQGVADIILARYADWVVIGAAIERIRLTAKAAVAAAQDQDTITTVINGLDWPRPE